METRWALPQCELSPDWCKQMNSDCEGQTSLDFYFLNIRKKNALQMQSPSFEVPGFRLVFWVFRYTLFICACFITEHVCMLHVYVHVVCECLHVGMCMLVCVETRGWQWLSTSIAFYLIFCYKVSGWVWGSPVCLIGWWTPEVLLSPPSQLYTTAPRFSPSSDLHAKPADATEEVSPQPTSGDFVAHTWS